jgi:hypothetical protein
MRAVWPGRNSAQESNRCLGEPLCVPAEARRCDLRGQGADEQAVNDG